MATTLTTILTKARKTLNEDTASFWSDAELLEHAIDGCRDLWRSIIDLHEGHFLTIDDTTMSIAANANVVAGVPADLFRVESIEARDLTTANPIRNATFTYRSMNHPDIAAARGLGSVDPNGRDIYFNVQNAGSPIAAPQINVYPKLTSALTLRIVYTPTLSGSLVGASTNPIPGESDHAIQAWVIAHARAKEREDRQPDPAWVAVYATDKAAILTALTPRQTQDPEVVEALFESYW